MYSYGGMIFVNPEAAVGRAVLQQLGRPNPEVPDLLFVVLHV